MSPGMPEAVPSDAPQIVIGFDFGSHRIGCAVGDTLTGCARPLQTLARRDTQRLLEADWQQITRLLHETSAQRIIIGQPYNVDGSRHRLSGAVDDFARQLAERYALPIHRVDERYSSLEAETELRRLRDNRQRRGTIKKEDVDSMAAALILERWLGAGPPA